MGDDGGGIQGGATGMYAGQFQVAHGQAQQMNQQQMQAQQQSGGINDQLNDFWVRQKQEVGVTKVNDFKMQQLPLARIKKIMKSDEDVKMISAEAPVLFAKACEMFIQELTIRAWAQTEEAKRRTLQRSDVSGAIQKTDIFDFLIDIVPRNETKEDEAVRPGVSNVDGGGMPYYQMGSQVPAVPYVMPQPMMGQGNVGAQMQTGPQVQASQDPSNQMFQPGVPNMQVNPGYNPAMYNQQPMMQQMPYMGMQQRQQQAFMQQNQPRYGQYNQQNQDQNQQSLH